MRILALGVVFGGMLGAQIITTIAGTDWSFPPTPLAAINAPLGHTADVAVDGDGSVYVADPDNNMVMKIAADGTLQVIAGNGIYGYTGDGGPATSAALASPYGIALDAAGNLYIADTYNSRIRKISPDGIITTAAGNGGAFFSGDGPALKVSLNHPYGVAVDSGGNVYIADTDNHRVRMVSAAGFITTVAGTGSPDFSGEGGPATAAALNRPFGVAVDAAGDILIADTNNSRVREIGPDGRITTVAGNGNSSFGPPIDKAPATSVSIGPLKIAFDNAGDFYIAGVTDRIDKVSPQGILTTIAGNPMVAGGFGPGFSGDGGPATAAHLAGPFGVALDSTGDVFIADSGNERVRKVGPDGIINTLAGNGAYNFAGDGGPATSAALGFQNGYLNGIAFNSAGNLYLADSNNNRVRKIASDGTISTIAGNGSSAFAGQTGPAIATGLDNPPAVAVDAPGNVYIAEGYSVLRVSPDGSISTVAGGGHNPNPADGTPATDAEFVFVEGLAVDAAGNLYLSDSLHYSVRKVSPAGILTTIAGNGTAGYSGDGGPGNQAQLGGGNGPLGVALDAAGNVYVADSANHRVRMVSAATGFISTVAGTGKPGFSGDGGSATAAELNRPVGVTLDNQGNLYISDADNGRVRMVTPGGAITTVAGNGIQDYAGDGGLATMATLNVPGGLALDGAGDLYIADVNNHRIREVFSGPPSFDGFPLPFDLLTGASILNLTSSSSGKPAVASLQVTALSPSNSYLSVPGMNFAASVPPGTSWLKVSSGGQGVGASLGVCLTITCTVGHTPGLLTVTADPTDLQPGIYRTTIGVEIEGAAPGERDIEVVFTVGQPLPAGIAVDRDHLSFTYAGNSAARAQNVTVSNVGSGALAVTSSVTIDSGSTKWLSVTPPQGTAMPAMPLVLGFQADPSGLTPGTYTAHISLNGRDASGNPVAPVNIAMTMTITTNSSILLLSQIGLTFGGVQLPPQIAVTSGGGLPPQTFGVLNLGAGSLDWCVETSVLGDGVPNWLVATAPGGSKQGSSSGGASNAPLVSVSIDRAKLQQLTPNQFYYGLVKVKSDGAANTPQVVVAALQVLPSGSPLQPVVQPTSLTFTATQGGVSPGSQDVLVYDPTGTNKSFRSQVDAGVGGQNWLATLPGDATLAPDHPTRIVVQPLIGNLPARTYYGTLNLQFSDGSVSAVAVTLVVNPPAAGAERGLSPRDPPPVCTPSQLRPSLISLGTGFNLPAGFSQGLVAQVTDDCGTPHNSGTVLVEFSNGDSALKLGSIGGGYWQGTWPAGAQNAQVTLTVTASDAAAALAQGQAIVNGGLGAAQPPPAINDKGVVSTVTQNSVPLAPGDLITILGARLADGTFPPSSSPQPSLGSAIVTIGDQQLPLFSASDGRIDAIVSYLVNENTNQQLLVQRGLTYAAPVYIDVASAQPAIQTIVDSAGNAISPANPAHSGDSIAIVCSGLGAVDPAVEDGAIAPATGAATVHNKVTVAIGGATITNPPAALAGGSVGLYRVGLTVPDGVTAGDQIPVRVTVGGQTSPAAGISLR